MSPEPNVPTSEISTQYPPLDGFITPPPKQAPTVPPPVIRKGKNLATVSRKLF